MAKVILTCGRLCSGKTTYSERLARELPAVHFSIDDITLLLLGPMPGDILDEYFEKLEGYFYEKAAETAKNGINAIIDIGLWTASEREYAKKFFRDRGVECEIHYLKVPERIWKERIEKRNRDVSDGKSRAYFVDENLLKKFESFFEEPAEGEVERIVLSPEQKS